MMTRFLTMEFNWWEEECSLIREIKKLKGINLGNQKEVYTAIEILEALDRHFYVFLIEHDIFFDETERELILNLYRKSIATLKKYEGVNIEKASKALNLCLRLIQLILGLLYDSYRPFGIELPKAVKDLI